MERPKYERLGYSKGLKDVQHDISLNKSVQRKKEIQCSHCNREGHIKDMCWDLHPCKICGLRNHSEKMCWKKDWKKEYIIDFIKMDCGWTYGPTWQKLTRMFKRLYKCSYVKTNRSHERFEFSNGMKNVLS